MPIQNTIEHSFNVWSYGLIIHMTGVYASSYNSLPVGNEPYD